MANPIVNCFSLSLLLTALVPFFSARNVIRSCGSAISRAIASDELRFMHLCKEVSSDSDQ